MGCFNRTRTLFGSFACVLITAGAAHGFTWYVDENADTTPHNGTSWCQAFLDLQGALAVAGSGDTIHVADGTYKPTSGTDRTATFQLITGVTIEGGYAGCGAGDPDERDIETYETILSGDIGTPGTNSDNSYHVVTGDGTDDTAVLDGFTITAGNATASTPHNAGGGMTNISGDPTVANCTFTGNSATFGGGMSVRVGATAHVINCVFTGNTAGTGGGMLNNGNPTVTDCTFSGNSASSQGGGMANVNASPTVTNCTFSGNTASSEGGGMANINEHSLPTVTDCTFSGNTASHGGGMYNYNNAEPTVTDCTFSGNSTTNFGGAGCSMMRAARR